jgi:hypothetical protein
MGSVHMTARARAVKINGLTNLED